MLNKLVFVKHTDGAIVNATYYVCFKKIHECRWVVTQLGLEPVYIWRNTRT